MADPADPQDPENLTGGWYELAIELQGRQRRSLASARDELWRLAEVESVPGGEVVRLPDGARVVCLSYAYPVGRSRWLILGLPLGALARTDPRVGAYPFDASDTGTSWRPVLDAWLASLAVRLFDTHPFALALVGMEASGRLSAAEVAKGVPVAHSPFGIVTVRGGPTYHPATRPVPAHHGDEPAPSRASRAWWTSWWMRGGSR